MKGVHFLILILVLQPIFPHLLMAENEAPPALQLAPGSGYQPPAGQGVVPHPGLTPAPGGGGAQEELRDIHPPLPLPEEVDYRMAAGGLFLLLVIFALISWIFRYRRGKRKESLTPAHELALAQLLELRRAMNSEQALYYGAEVGDILRRYIEKRFLIRTSRQTTREFFHSLTSNPQRYEQLLEEYGEELRLCLDQCDMAKFAHCSPDLQNMEKMESSVRHFIGASREDQQGGEK